MADAPPPMPPPRKKSAVRLGPFVILDEIGAGGMARVFRAKYLPQEGEQSFVPVDRGEVVVLKVMRNLADAAPEEAELFSKEADLLVMLDHPGIVQAITRGMHSGRVWIALEYVEGEDLGNVLAALGQQNLRMRPDVCCGLMHDLAAALAAAHALADPRGRPLGLVHRDVSPRNVLIDLAGQVRLFDFGTAVLTTTDPDGGTITGTPGYIAPEVARGEPLSAAADVYSLGVIFYELLTGRRAFPIENQPDEAILRTHAAGIKMRWPSRIPFPPEVVQVVDAMTSPQVEDRPSDGTEVYHLISPLVKDGGDQARYALSLVSRDLVLSNSDRPPPLFVAH